MGKYINIGNRDFQSVRNDIYVDKSMLIAHTNQVLNINSRKYMCITRARRFGKSMAAKMLCAYYDQSCDSRSLFADLQIAQHPSFESHLNQYPVIYLDATEFTSNLKSDDISVVRKMNDALSRELLETYPDVPIKHEDHLSWQLLDVVQHTGKQFIMIIDEWDAICRESNNDDVMRQYVNWLRGLFKAGAADRIFAGVYMTGILPIKQYNTESSLNNFEEFSMIYPGPLAEYFGFTNKEVLALAAKHQMDAKQLQMWYDGYRLGNVNEIYNPFAVMRAINRHKIASYWTATTTYENLKRYISMNFEGLRDSVIELLAGNEVRVDVGRFSNDIHEIKSRDAVLTLLIHLGYLSYNDQRETVRIPNYEVQREFERTIQDGNWKYLAKALNDSEQLLADTLAGNAQAVAHAVDYVHQDNTSILQYNDENSLACVLSLAYVAARKDYVMIRELPTGKGFADIVLIPRRNVDSPALVLELKYDHSAESAIDQIKNKRYADSLRDYVGDVVLVGISYDEKTKHHSCLIEHVDKHDDKLAGHDDKSAIKSLVGDKSAINSLIGDKLPADVDRDKCIVIIMYAQQHAIFKAQEISDLLGLQSSRTRDYLNALVVAELLQPHGANKNRTYTLK